MTAAQSSGPSRPPLSPLVGTAVAAATAVALARLGQGSLGAPAWREMTSPAAWAEGRGPADTALAVVRFGALVLCVHLACTGFVASLGAVLRRPRLVAAARRYTPAPFRSLLGRVGGLVLSAGTLLTLPGPEVAAIPPGPHATVTLREVSGDYAARQAPTPAPPNPSTTDAAPTASPPTTPRPHSTATLRLRPPEVQSEPAVTLAPPADALHRVVPGDHLWGLAETEVSASLGRPATDAEIAPYWRQVISANPQVVDPDLLYPGDVVSLPPLG